MVKILLDKNADINLRDDNGNTALTTATNSGRIEIVKPLLERKADTTIANHNKETALILRRKGQ